MKIKKSMYKNDMRRSFIHDLNKKNKKKKKITISNLALHKQKNHIHEDILILNDSICSNSFQRWIKASTFKYAQLKIPYCMKLKI